MRSRRRPWLTLLACVAAAGGVNAQVQPLPGDAAAGPAPAPADDAESGAGWQLPPLRLTGALSYDVRGTRDAQAGSSVSQLLTATIGARTFVYQPWFAQVNGTLNLTNGWTRGSFGSGASPFDSNDVSLHDRIRSREQFVTGQVRADVFPLSRFPFEAHYERSDSRIDSGLASPFNFRSQNYGVSQRYRPASGAYTLVGSYDHREQSGELARGTQDAFNGDFSTRWKANELALALSHSRAHSDDDLDESRFGSAVLRHNYVPSTAVSVNSTLNWTRTDERNGQFRSDISVVQGTSIGIWHREGSPLTLTASARALGLREHSGESTVDAASLTVGANYDLSQNLRFTGNGSANFNKSNGGRVNSFAGTAGVSYQSDGLDFAGFHYSWFGGGTAGTSVADGSNSDAQQSQQSLSLQVGHSLSRSLTLSPQSVLSFNAAQSVSWAHTRSDPQPEDGREFGRSRVLLNTLGTTWQMGTGPRTAYARATYSDSLELGGGHARFRLFNFQLSGTIEFDNRSNLVGNLTYQRTFDRPGTLFQDGILVPGVRTTSSGASGEVTFTQQRPFGMAGLRFVSRLRLAQDVQKQPGTLVSLPDRETRLWENRLDWTVGRLEAQLALRISQVDRRRVDSITFRVQRTFGD